MPLKPVWFYKGLLQLFTYWSWWQTSTNFDMKHECADAHPKHITICWHIIFPCLCCNDIPTFSELCIMTPSLLLLPAFSSFYSYISLWSLVYFVFFFFFLFLPPVHDLCFFSSLSLPSSQMEILYPIIFSHAYILDCRFVGMPLSLQFPSLHFQGSVT